MPSHREALASLLTRQGVAEGLKNESRLVAAT
jgi:hypothetical protein